jgi:transcriptional regulator with XRE-family HTH domain
MPSSAVSAVLDPVEIRQSLALSQERLGALLHVSPKTVSRWERDQRYPSDQDLLRKLAKLKEIVDLGLQIYQPQGLKEFLITPLPIFAGRSGLDLMTLGEFEPVIAALVADFEGTGL